MSLLPMILLAILAAAGIALVGLPAIWVTLQLLLARPGRTCSVPALHSAQANELGLCVLVPAHDEQAGLPATLSAVKCQMVRGDRLLVVADNCQDDTAAVAAGFGAEVVERNDSSNRGKGHALQYGVDYLRNTTPPAIVVVLDADCRLQPASLELLRQTIARTGRPAQALDLMRAPAHSNRLPQRLAEFAWRIKNWARAVASRRLGVPCTLYGTGMAFPWAVLAQASLANSHLAEDMQLGVELAISGQAVDFCEGAVVVSQFPDTADASRRQKERWEHGHMQVIGTQVPRLLLEGMRQRRIALWLLALDLAVPPLALLLMTVCAMGLFTLLLVPFGLIWPSVATATLVMSLATALVVAWHRFGRDLLGATELAQVPVYAVSKIAIYARFLMGQRAAWIRTPRAGDSEQP